MKTPKVLTQENRTLARRLWPGQISQPSMKLLDFLSQQHGFSIAVGDLLLLDGRWYVTLAGLLSVAARSHCSAINVQPVSKFCDPNVRRWVFKATVYRKRGAKGFVGYGDAEPSNISPLARGAEMRIAESRSVARALRKAYGIGLCSVEELGYLSTRTEPLAGNGTAPAHPNGNGFGNGHTRLRDRLCLLIRKHQLDPALVKRYAADYCGTEELREASRDHVESFITHLAESAARDRAALVCKLNSYAQPQEAHQ